MRAKFVHMKINACLELAPVSKKLRVNRPAKKIDARAFNRGNMVSFFCGRRDIFNIVFYYSRNSLLKQ